MDFDVLNSLGFSLTAIIAGVGVVLAIFLVFRQLVLWYFRINEIADDLHVIAQHYRAMDYNAKRQAAPQASQNRAGVTPAPIRPSA